MVSKGRSKAGRTATEGTGEIDGMPGESEAPALNGNTCPVTYNTIYNGSNDCQGPPTERKRGVVECSCEPSSDNAGDAAEGERRIAEYACARD
jgi:hypothetical protein